MSCLVCAQNRPECLVLFVLKTDHSVLSCLCSKRTIVSTSCGAESDDDDDGDDDDDHAQYDAVFAVVVVVLILARTIVLRMQ